MKSFEKADNIMKIEGENAYKDNKLRASRESLKSIKSRASSKGKEGKPADLV
jgi:hypothetical protein